MGLGPVIIFTLEVSVMKKCNVAKSDMLNKLLNIQHRFNPLHVYCRLVERGINKRLSIFLCKYYEIIIYSWIAWFTIFAAQHYNLKHPAR